MSDHAHTDRVTFTCVCGCDWESWGTLIGRRFVPEREDAAQCPNCLRTGAPQGEPEGLA